MAKTKLKVEGMTCSNCAKTIENTFESYKGIVAKVSISSNTVLFDYDDSKYKIKEIAKIIKKVGYTPIFETAIDQNKKTRKKMKKQIYISILLSFPLLWAMFSHIEFFDFIYVPELLTSGIFQFFLSSLILIIIGRRFYISAYKALRKKVLGMDALVVLGVSSAYLYSTYLLYNNLFINSMGHSEYYFEISALIITMILIGNYIEHIVKERTTDALVDLVNLGAKEARVLKGKTEKFIPIDQIKIGDKIIVLANEKIPVDGTIIKGNTDIDEAMITGESLPVNKTVNSKVIGATINLSEKIIVKTTKIGKDTLLAQIIQTVEEASASKPKIQRIADKVASIFVPVVVSVSIINFIVQFLILKIDFTIAFETSIAILVISCPCALGLATPTSILVGNGLAAKNNILYKGGEFFEKASKIEVVCFDKTGTLTIGKPEVTDFIGSCETLNYIYSIQSESVHPISKAVRKYGEQEKAKKVRVINYKEIRGKGITATVDGKKVQIGSINFFKEQNISLEKYESEYKELINQTKTVNFICINKKVEGLYAVRDQIKPTAKEVIKELQKRNLEVYMITGDNSKVAKVIGEKLNINKIYSEVLPNEKLEIVEQIVKEGKIVAFVGDGINDAPALKIADIGISMGSGTDIAISSSDVTLMSYDLKSLITAIDISKATLKNIYQNFFWAFSYNIIAIPLAATGKLSMMLAAIAMSFSSIMVVLNALRLKKYKSAYKQKTFF